MPIQGGKQDRGARIVAVGVIIKIAGGAVVNDPVVGVVCGGAGKESIGVERAGCTGRREDGVIQKDFVGPAGEIEDGIDIAGAERGGEGEFVGAAEPLKDIVA